MGKLIKKNYIEKNRSLKKIYKRKKNKIK